MEAFFENLIPLIVVTGLFIVLPYLVLRHLAHRRELELRHSGQPQADAQLLALAQGMERRIEALEQLLDGEVPGWREKHREQL